MRLTIDPFLRMIEKTAPSGDCLVFTGSRLKRGYGAVSVGNRASGTKRIELAHRIAYQRYYGEIPIGMVVMHKCDNPPCVEREHLVLGTYADNTSDMVSKRRGSNQKKTHCHAGHEYSIDNTHISPLGRRICRPCGRIQQAARRQYGHQQQIIGRTA